MFIFLTEDGEERRKVKKAGECCKKILNHVNQAVKEAENKQVLYSRIYLSWVKVSTLESLVLIEQHLLIGVPSQQRLEEYQRRLDLSSLKQSENPMILELKVRY